MKTRQIKRTFFTFLGYYLLVALLPLACIVTLYCNDMLENASNYMQENSKAATQGVMRSLESHLSIITEYPQQLSGSSAVYNYRYQSSSLNRLELINELKRGVGGNNLILNLFVYFRSSDTFVSAYANSWNRQSVLEGDILIYEDIPAATYMNLLEEITREQVIPATKMQTLAQEQKCEVVTFLDTLPHNNRYAYACTVTLVDAGKLRQLLQAGDADAYLLLDAQGQVIVAQETEKCAAQDILSALPAGSLGAQRMRFAGEEMVLSYCRSSTYGYTLVRVTSMQPFIHQRNSILTHVLLVLLGLTVLIVALGILFMQRTFKPIQALADMALRSGSESDKAEGTAFSLIRNALHSLETENIQLTTHLKKQNPILAQYAVRTLLSTPEEHWNQRAYEDGLSAGLRLNCEAYQVLVFQFESVERQMDALKNMIECFAPHYIASFPEALHNRIVLLLGYAVQEAGQETPAIPARLQVAAAGVGPVVASVRGWNSSYIRAALSCDCAADMHPAGQVMRFDEIPAEAYAPAFPWEAMQTLSAAINQSNTDMVRTSGSQLQAFISSASRSSIGTARSVFVQVLRMCRDVLPEMEAQIDEYLRMARLQADRLTSQSMADIVGRMLDAFCRQEAHEWAHRESSPIYRSLSIISEEIGSEHLSLAYVAERVGLSTSRYSALFPQEMNRNFKEYVSSLRLNLAKQLLRTTDLQISAVAARVGYQNAYSFARFFKSKMGCTPNEYREQAGTDSSS